MPMSCASHSHRLEGTLISWKEARKTSTGLKLVMFFMLLIKGQDSILFASFFKKPGNITKILIPELAITNL